MYATSLYPRSDSINRYSNTNKYYIRCDNRITESSPNTNEWLTVEAKLKETNNRDLNKILLGELEKRKEVIIKISSNATLFKEYMIGFSVHGIPGFMKFICFFKCEGDYKEYPKKNTKALCDGVGSTMSVLIMPYYKLGSIRSYKWGEDTYEPLKSCLLQIICSLIQAYETKSIIHNDMHLDNVLIKKTKRSIIEYKVNDKPIPIITNGYIISIMDFEQSLNETPDTKGSGISYLYGDLKNMLGDLRYRTNLQVENDMELDSMLTDLITRKVSLYDAYKLIEPLVNKIQFRPKPILSYTYNPSII